jgi:hypothetical protein
VKYLERWHRCEIHKLGIPKKRLAVHGSYPNDTIPPQLFDQIDADDLHEIIFMDFALQILKIVFKKAIGI